MSKVTTDYKKCGKRTITARNAIFVVWRLKKTTVQRAQELEISPRSGPYPIVQVKSLKRGNTSDWTMSELFYSPNTGTRCLTPPLRLWFRYSFQSQGLKTRLCEKEKNYIKEVMLTFYRQTFHWQDFLPTRHLATKIFCHQEFLATRVFAKLFFSQTTVKIHLTTETLCQQDFLPTTIFFVYVTFCQQQ